MGKKMQSSYYVERLWQNNTKQLITEFDLEVNKSTMDMKMFVQWLSET